MCALQSNLPRLEAVPVSSTDSRIDGETRESLV